jgi:hypothetical protein
MAGTNFFLYSGDKDENWGLKMADQMLNAQNLITKNGGKVVEYFRDPNGKHIGYRLNPTVSDHAIGHFMALTK